MPWKFGAVKYLQYQYILLPFITAVYIPLFRNDFAHKHADRIPRLHLFNGDRTTSAATECFAVSFCWINVHWYKHQAHSRPTFRLSRGPWRTKTSVCCVLLKMASKELKCQSTVCLMSMPMYIYLTKRHSENIWYLRVPKRSSLHQIVDENSLWRRVTLTAYDKAHGCHWVSWTTRLHLYFRFFTWKK